MARTGIGVLYSICFAILTYNLEPIEALKKHSCARVCQSGDHRTCYYRLTVHNYQRLGSECKLCKHDPRFCAMERCLYGDGIASPIIAVNYKQPGPAIEICEQDNLVVDVVNNLSENTTIHWHGFQMRGTPDMDGTPYITQYPIPPGKSHRYAFPIKRSGSLWYHSHVNSQRGLGLAGSFIIRQTSKANRHAQLYDYDLTDHVITLQDIFYGYDYLNISNIIINGQGRNHRTLLPDNDSHHRYAEFQVSRGKRYRMRIINNGIANCPLEFSIDKHKLLVISTDGNDISPVLVDVIPLASGERYDFILSANRSVNNYWIRVLGNGICAQKQIHQGAILRYHGAKGKPEGSIVSKPQTIGTEKSRNELTLKSLEGFKEQPWMAGTKFLKYYLQFGAKLQVNNITFQTPGLSLLQERYNYNDDSYFCNSTGLLQQGQDCQNKICECVQVIHLPYNEPIELIVSNLQQKPHPFHLHGYIFHVVAQKEMDDPKDLFNLEHIDATVGLPRLPLKHAAIQKDTIQVPGLGYIIIRFNSDNPGYWIMHCHIEEHAIRGMAAVFKVGENWQMGTSNEKTHQVERL